jgi:hypothetical protein
MKNKQKPYKTGRPTKEEMLNRDPDKPYRENLYLTAETKEIVGIYKAKMRISCSISTAVNSLIRKYNELINPKKI